MSSRACSGRALKAGCARPRIDASGTPIVDAKGQPVMIATKLVHDFRRTAARDLVGASNDYKTAMEIGGWKTTHVFLRYRIVDTRTAARTREDQRPPSSREPEHQGYFRDNQQRTR